MFKNILVFCNYQTNIDALVLLCRHYAELVRTHIGSGVNENKKGVAQPTQRQWTRYTHENNKSRKIPLRWCDKLRQVAESHLVPLLPGPQIVSCFPDSTV